MTLHDIAAIRPDPDEAGACRRIALVDTDRAALFELAALLRREGYRTESFTDPGLAMAAFRRTMPDLAVLDMDLPRIDGTDLLQRLRSRSHTLPVLLTHAGGNPVDEEICLRLGADDYLHKPFAPRVMVERIKSCLRRIRWSVQPGRQGAQDQRIAQGPLVIDRLRHKVTWRGRSVPLTVTEFLLLCALATHPGHVKSRDRLMDAIYDQNVYVEDRTVDSHVKRIRSKFRRIDPEFRAIETLYGIGYRLELAGA